MMMFLCQNEREELRVPTLFRFAGVKYCLILTTDCLLGSTLSVGVFDIPFVHHEEIVNASEFEFRSKIAPPSTPSPVTRATVSALPLVPVNNSGVSQPVLVCSCHLSLSRYSSGLTLTSTCPALLPGTGEVSAERRSQTSGPAPEASSGLQTTRRTIRQTSSAPGGSRQK